MSTPVKRVREIPGPDDVVGLQIWSSGSKTQPSGTKTPPPLNPPYTRSETVRLSGLISQMTDYITPDFQKLLDSGGVLPLNEMSRVTYRIYGSLSGFVLRDLTTVRDPYPTASSKNERVARSMTSYTGVLPGFMRTFDPLPSKPGGIVALAAAQMRSQLFDLGTFLAEVHKSVKLLRHAHSTFLRRAEFISKLPSVRSKRGSRAWAEFEKAWLEARYGWRQLYFDVTNAHEALSLIGRKIELVTGSHSMTSGGSKEVTLGLPTAAGSSDTVQPLVRYKLVSSLEIRHRGFCLGRLNLDKPYFIDPLVTAWEVVPYSFVLDWFFNVGGVLAGWSPFARGQVLQSGFSGKIVETRQAVADFPPLNASSAYKVVDDRRQFIVSGVLQREKVVRKGESVKLELPGFHPRLDAYKLTDLLTLFTGRHRSLKKNVERTN